MRHAETKGTPINIGGRPRKFSESSRPITVTLPQRTLTLLKSVDSDRAHAIVKATNWVTGVGKEKDSLVEIVEVEEGRAVIIVGPSRSLKSLPWLRLAEIAPARFLLIVPTGTPIEILELAMMDMVDGLGEHEAYERRLLNELRECLTRQRRNNKVSKAELLLIDTSD